MSSNSGEFHIKNISVSDAVVANTNTNAALEQLARIAVTRLNISTACANSVPIALATKNLANKALNNQLTSLDTLQFSVRVMFFENKLITPTAATEIIERAQREYLASIKDGIQVKRQ